MTYINKFDTTKQCAIQGQNAERNFKDILESEGYLVREATKQEQFEHVDFIATKDNKTTRFEVKARKKIKRGDEECQDELIWIEFIGVSGHPGWIYGSSSFIAFETEKEFLLVERVKLLDMVERKCNVFNRVFSPYDALYNGYQRKGRKDLISLVKESDVRKIADRIIIK